MKKLKVILIGAGLRGTTYTDAMQQMSDTTASPICTRMERSQWTMDFTVSPMASDRATSHR